ncbi:MAG: serine hydrolase [Lentisphaeria bacterium]|nr:serine hydrolase [Lentisphaeria bacterium]
MTSSESQRRQAAMVAVLAGAVMGSALLFAAVVHARQASRRETALRTFERDAARLASVWTYRAPVCDRYRTPLNVTVPEYALAVDVSRLRDIRDTRRRTLDLVEAEVSRLAIELWPREAQFRRISRDDLEAHLVRASPMPFILWRNVDTDTVQRWLMVRDDHPGVTLLPLPKRVYHLPDLAAAVRGRTCLTRRGAPGVSSHCDFPDLTMAGWFGAEAWRDADLSGTPGVEQLVLDAVLFRQGTVRRADPEVGEPVCLTLDMHIQHWAQEALRGLRGALVVMRTDGQILALADSDDGVRPTLAEGTEAWRQWLRGNRRDGIHRCLNDQTPPGSIAKLAVALAALDAGVITPETRIECRGCVPYGPHTVIACHKASGHGSLTLYEALRVSCNAYFLTLAERVGWERIAEMMKELGLGQLPGEDMDVPGGVPSRLAPLCSRGAIYTPAYKREHYETGVEALWRPIDTGFLAIGQADTQVTPLQAAVMVNAVATGKRVKPRLFLDEPYAARDLRLSVASREAVLQGMRQVVHHPNGTARTARVEDVVLASKTGTAERGSGAAYRKDVWLVAIYPGDAPAARIVLAAMAHDLSSGGRDLGPRIAELVTAIKEWEMWTDDQRRQWPGTADGEAVCQAQR